MSRHINVNPGHYKVRGRERQGEDILHVQQKQAFAAQDAERAGSNVSSPCRRHTRRNRPPRRLTPNVT